jgi:hypothetical protein
MKQYAFSKRIHPKNVLVECQENRVDIVCQREWRLFTQKATGIGQQKDPKTSPCPKQARNIPPY